MFIKIFIAAFLVFLVIDLLWLGLIAKNFYRKHLGFLMSDNVNWTAAIVFYLVFVAGIVLFVVSPALEAESLNHALLYGALFGFVTYATYDLTNLATLDKWPLKITIIDLIWGTVLSTSVSVITFLIFS
ncbi:MAG: DUF2177 family protein [Marinilabiliaceae bacterium]|jgi:uncharacterized membrane protein|nr:DUF2177 family protein [Marinilabiliaceae bacterium]